MFKDGPGALMELKIDDDDIETQPPEFLRHFLKTLKGDSDNQVDKMSKNADNDIADHLRHQILEDLLILKESDWRREERISTLNQMRTKSKVNQILLY